MKFVVEIFLLTYFLFQKGGAGLGARPFTFIVNQFNRYFAHSSLFQHFPPHPTAMLHSLLHSQWILHFGSLVLVVTKSNCTGLATSFIMLLSYTLSAATYDRVRPSLFVSQISFLCKVLVCFTSFECFNSKFNYPGGVVQHNSLWCLHSSFLLAGHAGLHAGINTPHTCLRAAILPFQISVLMID